MICILKFTKAHNSIKSVGEVKALILCTSSDDALYLYQVLPKYLKGFQITDLDSRVDARVVANVDRYLYRRTDGKPDPYIVPCLRQARQKCYVQAISY